MRLGYLYSRYPVLSQTFCDAEMLELERREDEIILGSLYPPKTALRHEYLKKLRAPIRYAPSSRELDALARKAKRKRRWPTALVAQHEKKYRTEYKAALRARNALFFVELFEGARVPHFHVHFANRAAHTAMFVKAISGIPFSMTAHGQEFMSDLGNDELLRELCASAEFVGAETDFSRDLLAARCPESRSKIFRVYNGIDLSRFPWRDVLLHVPGRAEARPSKIRFLSVGRLRCVCPGFCARRTRCERYFSDGYRGSDGDWETGCFHNCRRNSRAGGEWGNRFARSTGRRESVSQRDGAAR